MELYGKKTLSLKVLIMDSFPVKSILNTSKCLRIPKIDYQILKNFITAINLDDVIAAIDPSPKKYKNIKTKLLALLVKEIWDLQTWNRCWKVLTGKEAKEAGIALPYSYKSLGPFRTFENARFKLSKDKNLEKKLLDRVLSTLKTMTKLRANFHPKTLNDLNGTFHIPHRWKDPGCNQYYCTSKNEYGFGRGGIILVDQETEIPLVIGLTPKYKQNTESLNQFIDHTKETLQGYLQSSTLLADSEFGVEELVQNIIEKITPIIRIPGYGKGTTQLSLSSEEKTKRKTVERVIARLVTYWHLEHPRHVGTLYAAFHLQLVRFCDILQVIFNQKIKNINHLHAIIPIRG